MCSVFTWLRLSVNSIVAMRTDPNVFNPAQKRELDHCYREDARNNNPNSIHTVPRRAAANRTGKQRNSDLLPNRPFPRDVLADQGANKKRIRALRGFISRHVGRVVPWEYFSIPLSAASQWRFVVRPSNRIVLRGIRIGTGAGPGSSAV